MSSAPPHQNEHFCVPCHVPAGGGLLPADLLLDWNFAGAGATEFAIWALGEGLNAVSLPELPRSGALLDSIAGDDEVWD